MNCELSLYQNKNERRMKILSKYEKIVQVTIALPRAKLTELIEALREFCGEEFVLRVKSEG